MKCLILAAGYATRLYPLTENFPKPLLDVGGKTIVDWLIDDLRSANVIDEFVIISNHKFAHHFNDWAKTKDYKVTVVDDGTSSNETRLGAVKDIQYTIEKLGLDDDKLSPFVLIWNNDQYYVVGDCEKHGKITKYRLDRVANLEIIAEERVESPADFSVSDYFSKEFSMLAGEHCTVELICENKLINSLIDKFGTDFSMETVDDQHFKAKVDVALSGTFYGWVFASCGAMKIVSPAIAVDGFNAIIESYHS